MCMCTFDWQESAQTQTPADGSRSRHSTAAAKARDVEQQTDRPQQQLANSLPSQQADAAPPDEAAVAIMLPAAEQLNLSSGEHQGGEYAPGKNPLGEAAKKVTAGAPEMTSDEVAQRNLEAAAEANSILCSLGGESDIQCGQPPPSAPSELQQQVRL